MIRVSQDSRDWVIVVRLGKPEIEFARVALGKALKEAEREPKGRSKVSAHRAGSSLPVNLSIDVCTTPESRHSRSRAP